MSDACRGPEDDPLVHGDGLLVLVFLDCDVPAEEQQRERGHLGAIVEEDLRTKSNSLSRRKDRDDTPPRADGVPLVEGWRAAVRVTNVVQCLERQENERNVVSPRL